MNLVAEAEEEMIREIKARQEGKIPYEIPMPVHPQIRKFIDKWGENYQPEPYGK